MNRCDPSRGPAPDFPPYHQWLDAAYERLRVVTRRMLQRFPKVAQWDDPDDVLHGALFRLLRALPKIKSASPESFFSLAVADVRRECLDRSRRYSRPAWQALHGQHLLADFGLLADRREGLGESGDWSALRAALARLSTEDREFLRLLFWEGRSQDDVARLLQVSARTAQRRWTALLRNLRSHLNDD